MDLTLVIGNKNYSSWSLRPWILLAMLGIEFREVLVPLDTPQTRGQLLRYGPSGKVPVLLDGPHCVWDSLAICEYLAEQAGRGWPRPAEARAVARSVSAEMHSGFPALRSQWPMNARARGRTTAITPELSADIARIEAIWSDCRRRFGDGGPWLFGDYSVADAMYAPVVLRFETYGAQVSESTRGYMSLALQQPAMQSWLAAATAEPWTLAVDEVG